MLITYEGSIAAGEATEAERRLASALAEVGAPFDVIADVSAAEPLAAPVLPLVARLAALLVPAGLRSHVRVVGRSSLTALQFERISRAAGYEARLAFSRAEAERVLDGLP